MSDRIPEVTLQDVKRIILRDFPQYDPRVVIDILKEYKTETSGIRVQLAALKLSDGNLEKLKEWIAQANMDFRDVIMAAEYPKFSRIGFVGIEKLKRGEKSKLEEEDWQQYHKWLNRK